MQTGLRSGDEFAPPRLLRNWLRRGLAGGQRGVNGSGRGFTRRKACDEQSTRDTGGQNYERRLGVSKSSIEWVGMTDLSGATTKATDDRFCGVIVECDPANHDLLRRDRRRNGRATILTHGKRLVEGSVPILAERIQSQKKWGDGRLDRPLPNLNPSRDLGPSLPLRSRRFRVVPSIPGRARRPSLHGSGWREGKDNQPRKRG